MAICQWSNMKQKLVLYETEFTETKSYHHPSSSIITTAIIIISIMINITIIHVCLYSSGS